MKYFVFGLIVLMSSLFATLSGCGVKGDLIPYVNANPAVKAGDLQNSAGSKSEKSTSPKKEDQN